ncbi:hypothetical protein ZYGR_0I05500 [Zygosaccharomyces rouxii]|uniref:ZYRO0C13002p n=2 Tax=Zygosaccharomyces rouxii TaxID=4956 RepID=C5DU15_ZYGRC|nr:uncharacterized protein ZYRO0C13002g [Zygosaccharomyces rouxii]KAH9201548.1 hypothetical protein LQ764DRAFT_223447 [Zygosaccharomyces rouxii]GAV48253.1 hypothetical protein ZYGR_0I05500 [Zygosaccharomyces rouxii]CAR27276.1 ZYRO0C13002p [Zygosaccharomyces rouxii]
MPTETNIFKPLRQMQPQQQAENTELLCNSMATFEKLLYHHELQMQHLFEMYYQSQLHRDQLKQSLSLLLQTLRSGNKVVLLGCGKSHIIASKAVATLRSVGIPSAILHPTEAMHGDMGLIQQGDALLVCSSGGETDEIVQFLKYASSPLAPLPLQNIVKIGACAKPESTISLMCDSLILLPQRYPETEVQEGLKAPTLSTTSMLVTLDCLCISLSEMYYDGDLSLRSQIFNASHPSGGIGRSHKSQTSIAPADPELSTIDRIGKLPKPLDELNLLQTIVLYDWIQWKSHIVPSKLIQKLYAEWKNGGNLLESFPLEDFLERHVEEHT